MATDVLNRHDQIQLEDNSVAGSEPVEIHTWNGPDDSDNPFNWSKTYKWTVTISVCLMGVMVALPASSYGVGNKSMSEEFHVQNEPFPNLYWATCSWNIGAALFPPVLVPVTELTGRMPGYFASWILFEVFLISSCFAQNFATLVVTRFFCGGTSSIIVTMVGGSISDIWKGDKARSVPMSLFGLSSILGMALGPFIGAAIQTIHKPESWRWIFYVQIIYNGALMPLCFAILKESRGEVILAKRAWKLRKETGRNIITRSEIGRKTMVQAAVISTRRPLSLLVSEPVVTLFTLWVSFAWGILFVFFSSIAQTFSHSYNFNTFQTGLVQLAMCAGALIAAAINPLQDLIYFRSAKHNCERPNQPIPEARLYTAVPGSLLLSFGLFCYGWACQPNVHWLLPAATVACVGFGIYSIYLGVMNYLTDAYEKYAASAMSAASFGRNSFAAFLPLASPELFQNLGYGWAGSLLGLIGSILTLVPILLITKGRSIRARSPAIANSKYDALDGGSAATKFGNTTSEAIRTF